MIDLQELFYGVENPTCQGRIAIVGESWGEREAYAKRPFVGQSGDELTRMLADAGIARSDCFITNVCSRRPAENDMKYFFTSTVAARKDGQAPLRGLYPDAETLRDLARLHRQLAFIKPKVIIAFGNYALWALTQNCFSIGNAKGWKVPTGITNWRGSYLEWNTWDVPGQTNPELSIPLIPTYHPAAILRQWSWRTPAVHDLRQRVAPIVRGLKVPTPDYRFTIRPSFQEAIRAFDLLDALPDGHLITCDTETRGGTITCLGIAWSAHDAICIPFVDNSERGSYWTPEEEAVIRLRLETIIDGNRLRLSNQNINYDRQYWLKDLFIRAKASFDTMVAQHLCWPGTPKGLGYISSLYCHYHRYWKDDGRNWDLTQDEEILWHYNCQDCVITWEATQVLEHLMKKLDLYRLFPERMELLELAFEMMEDGIAIDVRERGHQLAETLEQIEHIGAFLSAIIPQNFKDAIRGKTSTSEWYSSPSQTASLFYDIFGVKEIRNRKTGNRTTDDDALLRIVKAEPLLTDFIEALQALRSLGVIYSTFLSAEIDQDNRMRCTWDPTGTSTFRWSAYENAFGRGTNLMNIPKEKDE